MTFEKKNRVKAQVVIVYRDDPGGRGSLDALVGFFPVLRSEHDRPCACVLIIASSDGERSRDHETDPPRL